jgi:DNA-directed RNA polymerase specialized sigma24 family protein
MTASELPAMQFETLFAQHYSRLARLIYRVVGDTARAEELAADASYDCAKSRPATTVTQWVGFIERPCIWRSTTCAGKGPKRDCGP